MSSNCPPQLQLSLQPSTTTFKRSFEQLGFDLESPVGPSVAGGSGNNGNDRSKRARSSSSLSEDSDSTGSSSVALGSESSSSSLNLSTENNRISVGRPIVVLDPQVSLIPPRLPTPIIEDIDMVDYVRSSQDNSNVPDTTNQIQGRPQPQQNEDSYRLSLERFNAFETEMSLIRSSQPSSPSIPRSLTPPPVLPPLSISTSRFHRPSSSFERPIMRFTGNLFETSNTRGEDVQDEASHNMTFSFRHHNIGFREHLSTALERLRSASPLGADLLEGSDEEEEEEVVNDLSDPTSAPPEPPTLPPIPSVAEEDEWTGQVAFLGNNNGMESPSATPDAAANAPPTPMTGAWTTRWRRRHVPGIHFQSRNPLSSSSPPANPSLRDHPLPSPLLRDLHSWMEEREHVATSSSSSSSMSDRDELMGVRGEPDLSDNRNSTNTLGDSNASVSSSSMAGSISAINTVIDRDVNQHDWQIIRTLLSSSVVPNLNSAENTSTGFTRDTGIFSSSPSILSSQRSALPTISGHSPAGNNVNNPASAQSPAFLPSSPSATPTRRNVADQVVRSLDHGINVGLGFRNGVANSMLRPSNPNPEPQRPFSLLDRSNFIYTRNGEININTPGTGGSGNQNDNTDGTSSSRRSYLPNFSWRQVDSPLGQHLGRTEYFPLVEDGDRSNTNSGRDNSFSNNNSPVPSSVLSAGPLSSVSASVPPWLPRSTNNVNPSHIDNDIHRHYPWTFNDADTYSNPPTTTSTSTSDPSFTYRQSGDRLPRPSMIPGLPLPARVRSIHGRSRPSPSASLVAETASEANRIAEYEELRRASWMSYGYRPALGSNREGMSSNNDDGSNDVIMPGPVEEERLFGGATGIGMRSNPFERGYLSSSSPPAHPNSSSSTTSASATSSTVEPSSVFRSAALPRRPLRRQASGPLLPLDTGNMNDIDNNTNTSSPSSDTFRNDDPFNFLQQLALGRARRLNEDDLGTNITRPSSGTQRTPWAISRPVSHNLNLSDIQQRTRPTDLATEPRHDRHSIQTPGSSLSVPGGRLDSMRYLDLPTISLGLEETFVGRRRNPVPPDSNNENVDVSGSPPLSRVEDNVESMQTSPSDIPTLPPPDFGGAFDADHQAQLIADSTSSSIYPAPQQHVAHTHQSNDSSNAGRTPNSESIAMGAFERFSRFTGVIGNSEALQRHSDYADMMLQRAREARTSAARIDRSRPVTGPLVEPRRFSLSMLRDTHTSGTGASSQPSTDVPRPGGNLTSPHSSVIDPESLRPGPLRNTLQHQVYERRLRQASSNRPETSVPPTIPPLSFGEYNLTSTPYIPERDGIRELPERPDPPRPVPPSRTFQSFASDRGQAMNENNRRRTTNSDLHSVLNRQVRIWGSRLEDTIGPQSRITQSNIEPLRPEGANITRQRQLVQQFHRDMRAYQSPHRPQDFAPNRPPDSARDDVVFGESDPIDDYRAAMISHNEISRASEEMRESLAAHMRGRRGRFARVNPDVLNVGRRRAPRAMGDFVRDEDFDDSYESLLLLTQAIGDAKPKSTPSNILEKMAKAQYKDWATTDSDKRCPICLDDYESTDTVLKLPQCSHWLHQDCLRQWLNTANTCPVCREPVTTSAISPRPPHRHHHYSRLTPRRPLSPVRSPEPNASHRPDDGVGSSSGTTVNSNTRDNQPPGNRNLYFHGPHYFRRPA